MRIRSLFYSLLLGSVFLFLAGCQPEAASDGKMQMPPTSVIVEAASRTQVTESLSLVGTLAADEMVEIKAETPGIVEEILFEEGQEVEKDTMLIRLDRRKLESAYEEAVANQKLSQSELARSEQLFQERLISAQEFDQAATRAESDRAVVALRERQLRDAQVLAPFAGTVGARNVSPGQVITGNETLTWLVALDPVKVAFNVPERFLSVARKGQAVAIEVAAFPGREFSGTVYFVSPFVDPNTRSIEVKARIPNPDKVLIPGMFANLKLTLTIRERALVIPEMAIFRTLEGDRAMVYVADSNQTAQMQQILIGERMPGRVEVLEGLSDGDRVIIEGTQKIGPGAPLMVQESAAPKADAAQ